MDNLIEKVKKQIKISNVYTLVTGNPVKESGEEINVRCFLPGHEDNHESLSLNTIDNIYFCHACNLGGSIIDMVMNHLNVSEYKAAEWLADKFNISYEKTSKKNDNLIEYVYTDENYKPIKKKVKTPDKKFWQKKFENGKWVNGVKSVKPILYNLPSIVKAIRENEIIFFVEGEKDADTLKSKRLYSTTSGSSSSWNKSYINTLKGAKVVIIPDNDKPGKKFAEQVANDLHNAAEEVKILHLPGLDEKEDTTDWFNKGGTREELLKLVDSCELWDLKEPDNINCDDLDDTDSDNKKENLATKIFNTAKESAVFFKDERGEFYAHYAFNDEDNISNMKSSAFNHWLQILGLNCNGGKAPYSEAISQAKKLLESYTYFEGEEIELNNRVAELGNVFYYDLGNNKAVKIDNKGWTITKPPLIFRSSAHQKEQIKPAESNKGNVWKFLDFVNVKKEDELLLIVSMISAFIPEIPHIVTIIHGPQGSAKSTLLEFMREVIDPSKTPLLRTPRAEKDLVQVFDHHYCSFFDNLRQVKDWLSDAFCQAVTGAGVEFRTLFTDDEAFIRQYRRVIGLTGINVAATQPDLLDRSILIELQPIPKTERKEIKIIKSNFRKVLPEILSGVFNTIVKAKNIYPDVELEELHRMADFTKWGYAIGEALGGKGQEFLNDYAEDEENRNLEIIEENPLGQAVLIFVKDKNNWTGAPGILLKMLEKIAENEGIDTDSKLWPGNSAWVTRRLNEIQPLLLSNGINYKSGKENGERYITFRTNDKNSVHSVLVSKTNDKPCYNNEVNLDSKKDTKKNSVPNQENSVPSENADISRIKEGVDSKDTKDTKKQGSLTKKNDLFEGVL